MDSAIVNSLCCPTCGSDLHLESFEDDAASGTPERIRWGVLLCERCTVWYPIYTYAPVLLTFETDLHRQFAARFKDRIEALGAYRAPSGKPQRGEEAVQRSFTEEWDKVQGSDLSFLYTDHELDALNERVWLSWLKRSGRQLGSVLNVGVGLGRESLALQRVTGAEVFAVDLNLAVVAAAERLKSRQGLHVVVASLFKLPFKRRFDLVYSQGVIHHTFSTRDALRNIAKYVAPDGYMFIWVYGLDDHLVLSGASGFATRALYAFEAVVRPIIARMPATPRRVLFGALTLAAHPLIKMRVNNKATWKLVNTDHDLRDWLSPQFAYRHSYNELFEWFAELNIDVIDVQSPAEYRKLFNKRLWGVGLTGHLRAPHVEQGIVQRQEDAIAV